VGVALLSVKEWGLVQSGAELSDQPTVAGHHRVVRLTVVGGRQQPPALFALDEGSIQTFRLVFQRLANLLRRDVLLKASALTLNIKQNGHRVGG